MRWLFKFPILLAVVALLLAACGGSDKKEDTPAGLGVGSPAPDFTLPTASGGTVSLDAYKGKQPVLLFFHMADG